MRQRSGLPPDLTDLAVDVCGTYQRCGAPCRPGGVDSPQHGYRNSSASPYSSRPCPGGVRRVGRGQHRHHRADHDRDDRDAGGDGRLSAASWADLSDCESEGADGERRRDEDIRRRAPTWTSRRSPSQQLQACLGNSTSAVVTEGQKLMDTLAGFEERSTAPVRPSSGACGVREALRRVSRRARPVGRRNRRHRRPAGPSERPAGARRRALSASTVRGGLRARLSRA